MVSSLKLEVFPRLYSYRAEAFVRLNHHKFMFLLDKANGSELAQEEILVDGAETELGF